MTDINPLYILIMCTAGTFFWRSAGVILSYHINPESKLFQWFNCVAYALLSGLITRVIVIPSGQLENTLLLDRLFPVLAGFFVFFAFKRNVIAATLVTFFLFLFILYFRYAPIS